MSLNARCQCLKCGNTYSVFTDELNLLPDVKINQNISKPKKILKTWQDWVEHLITNCPDCRLRRIPPDCLKDYESKKSKLQS